MRSFFIIESFNGGCKPTYEITQFHNSHRVLGFVFDIIKDCLMPLKYRNCLKHRYLAVCDKDLNPLFCIAFDFNLISYKNEKDLVCP